MGGNSSSRHVSLDEADEVTFVKGIRLSGRVIDRMKESQPVVRPQAPTRSPSTPPVESSDPDEHHVPIMPHSPSYASALVPPHPQSPEALPIPPPTGNEHVVVPDPQPGSANTPVSDPQPAKPINAVSTEPITAPPLVESTSAPADPLIPPSITTFTTEPVTNPPTPNPLTESVTSSESSIEPVETPSSSTLADEAISADPMHLPVASPVELETSPFPISIPDPVVSVMEESTVSVSSSGSSSGVVLPDEMLSKTPSTEKNHIVPSLIDEVEVFPPQTHVVNEEKLRKQIREDLQKLLNEEMKMAECKMQQQLEEEKAKAKGQARAAARLQIQEEVQKVLDQEKASQQTQAEAIRSEPLNTQDDRLITQYYWMERKAQKLEEKEKDLENQDALFRKQIAKMQEKAAQFTKVTAENYRKGLEDANNRFRRYQIKPVCLDLQSQILKCYSENKGQTMSCSNIASLYIQCVDHAKQDKKLSTGG